MAGDWIKMRGNLWDDPRVSRLVDLTDSSEAAIVGALYWLWATADQHSADGIMTGLTTKAIDRKTGVQGFGDALVMIGWIADHPEGVRIIRFDEHNGESAKCRVQTAKRVAKHTANAKLTQAALAKQNESVSAALPREREEKEKEKEESKAIRAPRFDFFKSLTDEGVPDQSAKDYIATRKVKRCAQTETAFKQFIVEVRRSGLSTAEIVAICCKKSWGGFESAWLDRDRLPQARGSPLPTTGRQSRIDNYAAQAAAARGENENEHGTGRTERDITSEAVRVA